MTDTVGPSVRSTKHILKRLVRDLKGDKDLTFLFSLARETALFFLLRSHVCVNMVFLCYVALHKKADCCTFTKRYSLKH